MDLSPIECNGGNESSVVNAGFATQISCHQVRTYVLYNQFSALAHPWLYCVCLIYIKKILTNLALQSVNSI